MNNRIANFIERPRDEYNNAGITGSQREVIKAEVIPGRGKPGTIGSVATLKIIEPDHIKDRWPTQSALYWQEVDHSPGPISMEKWLELLDPTADYTLE